MAVIYYRSDDASAPSLTGQVGSLVTVLDAILVAGYGSKAAAGWTKPFTGSNKAAFRQATGAGKLGHYLRVLDDGTLPAATLGRLRSYVTMSDVDTGTEPSPTVAQITDGAPLAKSGTADAVARAWVAIADDTFFTICIQTDRTAAQCLGGTPASGTWSTFTYGQIESELDNDTGHNFLYASSRTAFGTPSSPDVFGTTVAQGANVTNQVGHYLTRPFYQSTGAIQCCKANLGKYTSASSTLGAAVGPVGLDPLTGRMNFSKIMIKEPGTAADGVVRGYLPFMYGYDGAVTSAAFLASTSIPAPYTVVSGQGSLASRTFLVVPVFNGTLGYPLLLQISGDR